MARKTKTDWFVAGAELLQNRGARAMTIDALCSQIQMTKGSFYHHFNGIDDYVAAFLIYFEQEGTLQIIDDIEQISDPKMRLRKLIDIIIDYLPDLEVSMRAWALQDERVQAVYERVDQQRIAYVSHLWHEITADALQADLLANMMYCLFVGGQHTLPAFGQDQMRAMFDFYLESYNVIEST